MLETKCRSVFYEEWEENMIIAGIVLVIIVLLFILYCCIVQGKQEDEIIEQLNQEKWKTNAGKDEK